MTDFYEASGAPGTRSQGSSATMRNEFALIQAAFEKLAGYSGNNLMILRVNAGGTAYEAVPLSSLLTGAIITTPSINGGSANNMALGASVAASVRATTIEGTDTTDATSTTAAAMKIAGGLAVAKKAYFGDNLVMASGKGMDFTPAGGDVFDYYERGTFTPVLSDLANEAPSAVAVGYFERLGDKVSYTLYLQTSSLGALLPGASAYIGGLPFVSDATPNLFFAVSVGGAGNMAITAGQSLAGIIEPGAARIRLQLFDSATGTSDLLCSEWSTNGTTTISGFYKAA